MPSTWKGRFIVQLDASLLTAGSKLCVLHANHVGGDALCRIPTLEEELAWQGEGTYRGGPCVAGESDSQTL